MKKNIFKKLLLQILAIAVASSVLGILANSLNPNGVTLSSLRPVLAPVADDVLSIDLGETVVGGLALDSSNVELSQGPVVINTVQLKKLLVEKKTILLDARLPEEYKHGHIPTALNVPFESIGDYIDTIEGLPKDKWIVCYCDGPPCDLGELLAFEMFMMEFPYVAIYAEGLDEWKQQGGELGGINN
jgi:rhodanese-related sulfurtransferase